MPVSLLYFTGQESDEPMWYAARVLAFTKATRLQLSPEGFEQFLNLSPEALLKELQYMSSTIASSWEFLDLIFLITQISQACMRQMTRTRTASFAVQSQRVTDMSAVTCHVPPGIPAEQLTHYQLALSAGLASYQRLVKDGVSLEDARGVLPMNVHCSLIAKYNFRAWVDLIRARDSLRVQDEYHEVILAMKREVLTVWPWASLFLEPKANKAINLIESVARELPPDQRIRLAKAADLLKKEAS